MKYFRLMPLLLIVLSTAVGWADDTPNLIHIGNPDGSGMKPLLSEKQTGDFTRQGSPAYSPDGKWIAFDAWRPDLGESGASARLFVVNLETREGVDLIDGAMPSFSPKANRIAFSRYGAGRGVWIVNRDDPKEELLHVDPSGWGIDWSPKGDRLVYATTTAQGANFTVMDIVEGTVHQVFDNDKLPYSYLYWNFAWSPDGTQIVYRGKRRDNDRMELGVVAADGVKSGWTICYQGNLTHALNWRPDGKQVQFGMTDPALKLVRSFVVPVAEMQEPVPLAGAQAGYGYYDFAFSPDGKQMAVALSLPKK